MEIADALIIAAAGVLVVFFGLIVTNFLILALPRLLSIFEYFSNTRKEVSQEPIKEKSGEVRQLKDAAPDVVAVISTVLEIERRLSFSSKVSRYTFKNRSAHRSGLVR